MLETEMSALPLKAALHRHRKFRGTGAHSHQGQSNDQFGDVKRTGNIRGGVHKIVRALPEHKNGGDNHPQIQQLA